jgi:hypothetical protein
MSEDILSSMYNELTPAQIQEAMQQAVDYRQPNAKKNQLSTEGLPTFVPLNYDVRTPEQKAEDAKHLRKAEVRKPTFSIPVSETKKAGYERLRKTSPKALEGHSIGKLANKQKAEYEAAQIDKREYKFRATQEGRRIADLEAKVDSLQASIDQVLEAVTKRPARKRTAPGTTTTTWGESSNG